MRLPDYLEQIYLSFSTNKFKTMLSSLGIIIGVIAIVVMLSVGEGLEQGFMGVFGDLDLDVITVTPGGFSHGAGGQILQKPAELTDKDVHVIDNVVGVLSASPRKTAGMQVKFRNDERSIALTAVKPSKEEYLKSQVEKGRFLVDSDRTGIIIGHDVAENMFNMQINPGMKLTFINKDKNQTTKLVVVGVLKEAEATSPLAENTNNWIYTTHHTLKNLLDTRSYTYSQILVRVENAEEMEAVSENIDTELRQIHRDESYTLFMMKAIVERLQEQLKMVQYTLGGIGAIALLVGGIGIVNVMMLTVTERIKEIGIMKAVGANRNTIQTLFLLESAFLGFISGGIGATLGAIISYIISHIAGFPLPLAVTWKPIIIGLAFGVFTTMIAGIYPANKASRLDPVEALRTE